MLIRLATAEDWPALWPILSPIIRAGDTYALDSNMGEAAARQYWLGEDKTTYVAEEDKRILGTYYLRANQAGGGRHVCNCGYMTATGATGRGIARTMCTHSLIQAREQGFRSMQFNFVVSTNDRAVRLWISLGFKIVGTLPRAFEHPSEGLVDAYVMYLEL